MIPSARATKSQGGSSSGYIKEIDALRGVAVIAVLINHLNKNILPFGYLGVDIFFAISGFVITLSLVDQDEEIKLDMSGISSFYRKRAYRILPALIVFTIVTGLAISLFDPWNQFSLRTGIFGLFGLSNLYLLRYSLDYFSASGEVNPFLNTWSLGVEEQYYFIYPIFLVLISKAAKARGVKALRLLLGTLVIVSLASFVLYGYLSLSFQGTWGYFLMPARLWQISIGGIGALLIRKEYKRRASPIAIGIYTIALFSIIAFPGKESAPVVATLLTLLATTMSVGLLLQFPATPNKLLYRSRVLQKIGKASYSLYLWHWPIIVLFRFTIGINTWTLPWILGTIFVATFFSYVYVEQKFRHPPEMNSGAKGTTILSSGLIGTVFVLHLISEPPSKVRSNPLYLGVINQSLDEFAQKPTDYLSVYTHRSPEACRLTSNRDKVVSKLLEKCSTLPESSNSILAIGDSHAMTLLPALDLISEKKGTNTTLAWAQCHYPAGPVTCSDGERKKLEAAVASYLKTSRFEKNTILTTAYFPMRLFSVSRNIYGMDLRGYEEHIKEGTSELIANLKNLDSVVGQYGAKVVLMINPPVFTILSNATLCSPQWFRPGFGHECRRDNSQVILKERSYLKARLASELRSTDNITIYDPLADICPEIYRQSCTPFKDGSLIYHDPNHLNKRGATMLWERIFDVTQKPHLKTN